MLDQLVEIANKRIAIETKRLDIIGKLVELGNRSVVYQTKARIKHSESKNEYNRVILKQKQARQDLSKFAGTSENRLVSNNELPEVALTLDEVISIALEKRPEKILIEQKKKLSADQYKFEHNRLLPLPSFVDMSYHFEDEDKNWTELMVGIKIPIFNWNLGNIRATGLAVKKEESQLEALNERIENEVTVAYNAYSDNLIDFKNFENDSKELNINVESIVSKTEEHDIFQPDEVLELELSSIESQKSLCEKRNYLYHSLIELCFAMGIENPNELFKERS
jgi:outer membrane protein TolC